MLKTGRSDVNPMIDLVEMKRGGPFRPFFFGLRPAHRKVRNPEASH